jgi:hypothetical protein
LVNLLGLALLKCNLIYKQSFFIEENLPSLIRAIQRILEIKMNKATQPKGKKAMKSSNCQIFKLTMANQQKYS